MFADITSELGEIRDTLSGSFASPLNKSRAFLGRLLNLVRRPVSPRRIIKAILRKAQHNPYANYGGDELRDLLSCVVRINAADWDAYYHAHQAEVEDRITRTLILRNKDNRKVVISNNLQVALQVDEKLHRGAFEVDLGSVAPWASRIVPPDPTEDIVLPDFMTAGKPVAASNQDKPSGIAVSAVPGLPAPNGPTLKMASKRKKGGKKTKAPQANAAIASPKPAANANGGTPVFAENLKSVYIPGGTPQSTTAPTQTSARLENVKGARFAVHPDNVIGVNRSKPGCQCPDISLDPTDYYYVSQTQGCFTMGNNCWNFVHMGKQPSSIKHPDGMTTTLSGAPGVSCPLEHGATITFAGGAPALTFWER